MFSLVALRPDLVTRAVRQIKARMSTIIRLSKNDGKIDRSLYDETRAFLNSYFNEYFTKYYSHPEDALFSVNNWSIFYKTGKRFYHNMLESHIWTLRTELKKHRPFSRLFPLLRLYSGKRAIRYEAMKLRPNSYPQNRRPYLVAKDKPLLAIVEKQTKLGLHPSDYEVDEMLACIAETQRSRKLIDVNDIAVEVVARLQMVNN